jgi:hypothetical protein
LRVFPAPFRLPEKYTNISAITPPSQSPNKIQAVNDQGHRPWSASERNAKGLAALPGQHTHNQELRNNLVSTLDTFLTDRQVNKKHPIWFHPYYLRYQL